MSKVSPKGEPWCESRPSGWNPQGRGYREQKEAGTNSYTQITAEAGWWWGGGGWWKPLSGAGGREEPAPPGLVAEVNKHPEPITLTAPGGGRDEGADGLWQQRAPLS